MKVYFLKSNLSQYQIYPEPEDKTEYVLMDVTDDSALDKKQLILRDGQYIFVDKVHMTPETIKKLMDNVDDRAASIYSTWTRFESEYRERQAAAEAFKAANYEGECSRYITDFAQRARLDNKTATNLILTQAAGLEKLQMELANQRMRKYELTVPGLTLEQMQVTYDDIIKQMDNLMEAYQNG